VPIGHNTALIAVIMDRNHRPVADDHSRYSTDNKSVADHISEAIAVPLDNLERRPQPRHLARAFLQGSGDQC
jgi:hypothetical protein